MSAASEGDADAVRSLLTQGANVNEISPGGQTPLMRAVIRGHAEIVRLLIDAGADVQLKDSLGLTAMDWSDRRGFWVLGRLLKDAADFETEPQALAKESAITSEHILNIAKRQREATHHAEHFPVEEPSPEFATPAEIKPAENDREGIDDLQPIMAQQDVSIPARVVEQAQSEPSPPQFIPEAKLTNDQDVGIGASKESQTTSETKDRELEFDLAAAQTEVLGPADEYTETLAPELPGVEESIEEFLERVSRASDQSIGGHAERQSEIPTGLAASEPEPLESLESIVTHEEPQAVVAVAQEPDGQLELTDSTVDQQPQTADELQPVDDEVTKSRARSATERSLEEARRRDEEEAFKRFQEDVFKKHLPEPRDVDQARLADQRSTPAATSVKVIPWQAPRLAPSSSPTLWVLVGATLLASGLVAYLLINRFTRIETPTAQLSVPTPVAPAAEAEVKKDLPTVGGALSGMEVNVPEPEYPARAKSEGVSGSVTVRVQVNQKGRVISARSSGGDPRLRAAAVKAAQKATFSPEKLASQGRQKRVVSGTITYNFVAKTESASATGSESPAQTDASLTTGSSSATGSSVGNVVGNYPQVDGALAGAERNLPQPDYPKSARSKGISGTVTVLLRVDRSGRVISWRTLEGDSQLRGAAVKAARKATFSPEKLPGTGEVVGTITYNFKP